MKTELDCEFYSDMAVFCEDMNLHEGVAPHLNQKLASGEIKSIDDLALFFIERDKECRKQAQLKALEL